MRPAWKHLLAALVIAASAAPAESSPVIGYRRRPAGVPHFVFDKFTRANGSVGTPLVGGTYNGSTSNFSIASNRLAEDGTNSKVISSEAGTADARGSIVASYLAGSPDEGIVFRRDVGTQKFMLLYALGASMQFSFFDGTSYNTLQNTTQLVGAQDVMSVDAHGSSLIAYLNGTSVMTRTDSTVSTQTSWGVYAGVSQAVTKWSLLQVDALGSAFPVAPTNYAQDTFTRADETALTGPELGVPYAQSIINPGSDWGVTSDRLQVRNAAAGNGLCACVNARHSNFAVSATISTISGTQDWGVVARAADNLNWNLVNITGTTLDWYHRISGVYTKTVSVPYVDVAGDAIKVDVNGSAVTVSVNGVTKISTTETNQQSSTTAGIYSGNSQTSHRWSNFTVTPP